MSLKDLAKSMIGKTIRVRCVEYQRYAPFRPGVVYDATIVNFSLLDDIAISIQYNRFEVPYIFHHSKGFRMLLQPTVRERV